MVDNACMLERFAAVAVSDLHDYSGSKLSFKYMKCTSKRGGCKLCIVQ